MQSTIFSSPALILWDRQCYRQSRGRTWLQQQIPAKKDPFRRISGLQADILCSKHARFSLCQSCIEVTDFQGVQSFIRDLTELTLFTPGLARWSSRFARGPFPVTIAWTKNPNLHQRKAFKGLPTEPLVQVMLQFEQFQRQLFPHLSTLPSLTVI